MKKTVGELVVIVVGVLIALFAENLWSERADEETADRYVTRVMAEMAFNVDQLDWDRDWAETACPASMELLGHMRGEPLDDDPAALLRLAATAIVHNSPSTSSATYDDLVATGSFGLIKDPVVREAILNGYAVGPGREAYRPPLENALRAAVTRALPEPFIRRMNAECLSNEDGRFSLTDPRECEVAPESEAAEAALARLMSTAGLEDALAERVFRICQWDYHVDLMTRELTSALDVLERAGTSR